MQVLIPKSATILPSLRPQCLYCTVLHVEFFDIFFKISVPNRFNFYVP